MEETDSSSSKRKRKQVFPHDVVQINEDGNPDTYPLIIGGSTSTSNYNQFVEHDKDLRKHIKDFLSEDLVGSSTNYGSRHEFSLATSSETAPLDFSNTDESDYGEDDYDDEEDYGFYESITEDNDSKLSVKFDNLDLPTGVEAIVPWLLTESCKKPSVPGEEIEKVDQRFKSFKQFDIVQDHSDHHFSGKSKDGSIARKPAKDWGKKIQHEWKILEDNLPETIFVRVYEDRMDLLRAVIIGPSGTPYHDGLFFFDIHFPCSYPQDPPKVHYHSGGLRLNPNLYACGKVCLSLLGTWTGRNCEKWDPSKSTMLQVLVSIQALVLNEKPYFNEPGYAGSANTPHGEKESKAYNENTFLLSCTTMLYSLRKPLKNFEDFVAGHFKQHGGPILAACKAYMDGVRIVGDVQDTADAGQVCCSAKFRDTLKKQFEELLLEFTVKGADCNVFLQQKVKEGKARAAIGADSTSKI